MSTPNTPQKIGIDARSIQGQKTGKEWYTFSLLEALLKRDTHNTYYLYTRYDFEEALPDNCKKRVIKTSMLFWHIAVMIDMFREGISVYLATASYIIASMLWTSKIRVILTVHDLVTFLHPEQHDQKARIIEKITAKLAFSNASQIICPSQSTKDDIESLFPSTKKKTICIPEAARSIFRKIEADDPAAHGVLSKYPLPDRYILNIGTISPRKNIVSLLRAYSRLPIDLRASCSLIIIGKKGWYYEEVFTTVQKLNIQHNVVFLGYVDDYDLPYILSKADAFIYPSKYEGFGLPLLEAMHCEVPVISSNTKALLEVAEGVCHIVDHDDVADITEGMLKVLTDVEYQNTLIQNGIKRAQEYSWDTAAEQTLEVLN